MAAYRRRYRSIDIFLVKSASPSIPIACLKLFNRIDMMDPLAHSGLKVMR